MILFGRDTFGEGNKTLLEEKVSKEKEFSLGYLDDEFRVSQGKHTVARYFWGIGRCVMTALRVSMRKNVLDRYSRSCDRCKVAGVVGIFI